MSEEQKSGVNPVIWIVVAVAVVAAVVLGMGGVDSATQWATDAFTPKD